MGAALPTWPTPAAALLGALLRESFVVAVTRVDGAPVLRVTPASRLDPERRAAIRQHKAELLALLCHEASSGEEPVAVRRRAPHDPRPELDGCLHDAVWWSVLLALSREVHGAGRPSDVCAALHACRCLGAGLARTPSGGLRIVSVVIPSSAWPSVRATWLVPHGNVVTDLLRAIAATFQRLKAELTTATEEAGAQALVRRVWPDARPLRPAELAAVEALPVISPAAALLGPRFALPPRAGQPHQPGAAAAQGEDPSSDPLLLDVGR